MKPYRLLILSLIKNPTPSSELSGNCFERIAADVFTEFKKLPHVETYILDVESGFFNDDFNKYTSENELSIANLRPDTDAILFIGYDETNRLRFDVLREKTGYKFISSLLEIQVNHVDWCFYFRNDRGVNTVNSTFIGAPCAKKMMINIPKKKAVVLDHWTGRIVDESSKDKYIIASYGKSIGKPGVGVPYQADNFDWLVRVLEWLEDIKDSYEIRRMTRFINLGCEYEEELNVIPKRPYEIIVPPTCYGDYLKATADVETFIANHQEGYGYGIIDMVARGIRVISPPGFLSADFVSRFQIPIYHDKDSFLSLVTSKSEERWNSEIDNCTDWSDVVRIIDSKFQEHI